MRLRNGIHRVVGTDYLLVILGVMPFAVRGADHVLLEHETLSAS